nr:transient receptor potential cation channel subfamily V member 5 isoform X1 [Ciona intestinalis]|eukprot:XP_026696440.1 transient receptor potential cation channel subfamily V member 5 isoform X1 [Ciona intestinalis]
MKAWNRFFYRNPKGSIDADRQWKLQNELVERNPIYKMVDFSGGGSLLEEYKEKAKDEPDDEKINRIKEYFETKIKPEYLLGGCEVITEKVYQDWHNRQSHRNKLYLEAKEKDTDIEITHYEADKLSIASLATVIKPFNEHMVAWKLDKRGAVGETPMHLLFLNNTENHTNIARVLLEQCPELAKDIYEGEYYYGESCLHLAIIQQNVVGVKILLNTNNVNVHERARGKFFLPVDIKRGDVKLRKHKYEGFAYYGEYPLSFAASVGNHEIYDLLIDHGSDPTLTDRFGNNVLHMTVIHNQPGMYYYVLKHSKRSPDPNAKNKENLTPLALASFLGKQHMFEKILEISAKQYWSYNTVTCSVYPLRSLDSIGENGETDWDSALMKTIRGTKDNHLDMISNNVVHRLLNEKWEKFGRNKFYRLLAAFLLHILFLTIAVYLRPNLASDLRHGSSSGDIARYVFESLVIFISLFVLYFAVKEVYLEHISGYLTNIATIPSRLIYTIGCLLILLCIPMRFTELYAVEDWLLVFAVPGIWSYLLFFLRNSSLTGPFITMIYKMLATDMARFGVIYIIILTTSSVAFFYQFTGQNVFAFLTESGTFMTLIQMSFGEFSYDDVLNGKYQAISIILFIIFMLLVHVLLLSMLIAMMTRTYEKIYKKAEKVWRKQWASMVIIMERSHRNDEKLKFQEQYMVNFSAERVTSQGEAGAARSSSNLKDRALMVVQNQVTSESQRKHAVQASWKKFGRKIIRDGSPEKHSSPSPMINVRGFDGMVNLMSNASKIQKDEENSIFDDISHTILSVSRF